MKPDPANQQLPQSASGFVIRPAAIGDLAAITTIDRVASGMAKPDYWRGLFDRLAQSPRPRFFLVAEQDAVIVGFIIGEVRAWEFGSEPCGWVFAIGVDPARRIARVGTRLFAAVCERFKQAGVTRVRTMLRRDATLLMSFFRSQGMMAGPFLQLEMDLDEESAAAVEHRETEARA